MINYDSLVINQYTDPFPHITIDNFFTSETLNSLKNNFNTNASQNKIDGLKDQVQTLVKNNIPNLNKSSKHYTHNFRVDASMSGWDTNSSELLRDTHADGPSKYFQCLVYLYPTGVTSLNDVNDGRLELMECVSEGEMDYNTSQFEVSKILPYTDNRAVAWQSSYFSAHRFYNCKQGRRTITFSMVDIDNEQNFWNQRITGEI